MGGLLVSLCSVLQWNAKSLVRNGQELNKFVDRLEKQARDDLFSRDMAAAMLRFVISGYESLRLDRAEIVGSGG